MSVLHNIFRHVVKGISGRNYLLPSLYGRGLGVGLLCLSLFSSCNKEPDESDLYTFTGQTIQEFVEVDDNLSLTMVIWYTMA